MAAAEQQRATTLYNNPVLSDVRIKQVYSNGKTREYFAHKAILCANSAYFMKAFTGNFKEATEPSIELHDDDPQHFEFLLKFIYTNEYDHDAVARLVGGDNVNRMTFDIKIYAIADKYNVPKISEPAAEAVRACLNEVVKREASTTLQAVIKAHYGGCVSVDGAMGDAIAFGVVVVHKAFKMRPEFEQLIKAYPVFGADVALMMNRLSD